MILYIFLLLPLLISGCRNDVKISPILQRADSLVYTNPDSAYHLLSSLPSPKKSSELEYATWCLLMTQATDKSNRKHTSDSLIHIAVRYFSEHNEQGRFATAYYTQGRVEKELGYNDKASQSFLKSLDISKGSTDYDVQFLAASQLGTLYAYSNLIDKAFDSYQKALHFAEIANDSIYLSYVYSYLGRIYGLKEDWKQAENSYKQAIHIAENISNIHSRNLGLTELSSIYRYSGKYTEAFDCLQKQLKSVKELSPNNEAAVYLNTGDLYRYIKSYDLAVYYLNKALQTTNLYTKRSAYHSFYYLYNQQGNYQKAVEYNNLYWECNDSIQKVEKRQALIEAEGKYNNEKLLSEKRQLELEHSRQLFIGIIFILLIIIAFLAYYLHKKRVIIGLLNELNSIRNKIVKNENAIDEYKKEISKLTSLQSEVDNLHQIKSEMEQEMDNLVKNNDLLNEQKAQIIVALKQRDKEIEQYEEQIRQNNNTPDILTRISLTGKIEEDDWQELISYTNGLHLQFTKRLKKSYPQLLETDIRLCCLIKLGYTRSEQIELLSVTEDNLDKKKQRLKKRFDNNRKWRKGEFEEIIRLF